MQKFILLVLLLCISILTLPAGADTIMRGKSSGMPYRLELVAEGHNAIWGMAFLTPTQIIFTQRNGVISLLDLEKNRLTKLEGGPKVFAVSQGGLMDVAVQPGYQPGGWIYFTYSKPLGGEAATALARAKLNGDQLTDWQDLLVTKSKSDSGRHFGSRITFDGKGHLFFGVGDRGHRPNGQDLSTHAGTIMRVTLDGKAPPDNPFVNKKNALPEIWSYGVRNPQGLVYDRETGRLWEIEHGPRGGDEINLIEPGKNYGWPVISYGKEYWGPVDVGEGTERPGMEQPVLVYTPSIAPASLLLYTGKAFPAWRGNLFSGALKLQHINRVEINNKGQATEKERLLKDLRERIRSLVQSPEGWIYVGTDSGIILRIVPDK